MGRGDSGGESKEEVTGGGASLHFLVEKIYPVPLSRQCTEGDPGEGTHLCSGKYPALPVSEQLLS